MKFKKFAQLKEAILERALAHDACQSEYERASEAKNKKQLLQVIKDNISFCVNHEIIDDDVLEFYGEEYLAKSGIYIKGEHSIQNPVIPIILLGSSSATVETWGSSSATVKTWGSSSATVETWGSSSATVETLGSSSATVETLGSSSATVETWGSSSATVETWGSSSATVETWGSSSKLDYEVKGDYSNVKDLNKKQLHIVKDKFTIIEVELKPEPVEA